MEYAQPSLRSARILGSAVGLSLALILFLTVIRGIGSSFAAPLPLSTPEIRRQVAAQMSRAVFRRSELLKHQVIVHVVTTDGRTLPPWTIALVRHPDWVTVDFSASQWAVIISAQKILDTLTRQPPSALPTPVDCTLTALKADDFGVLRAQTSCTATDGYAYDPKTLAESIKQAFDSSIPELTFTVATKQGIVHDVGPQGLGDLTLLATGQSNFKGSGEGRKANVRKALGEKVNNVVIPAGAAFSFNAVLGGPVDTSAGWRMALAIFEGVHMRPVPGGGICQASTTVYRAALKAGFPILEHKNHSLYVTYYEAHGVGQDATVYPGRQNLTFFNDSGGPLLLQAYDVGDDAYVSIFGKPDGRSVTMVGPYFGKTAPADVLVDGRRPVRNNEIAWVRTVKGLDGKEQREVVVSRYPALPRTLASRWPVQTEYIVHAAATSRSAD